MSTSLSKPPAEPCSHIVNYKLLITALQSVRGQGDAQVPAGERADNTGKHIRDQLNLIRGPSDSVVTHFSRLVNKPKADPLG